jgi:hypothetical protein
MSDESEILARHAERRRAFLLTTAKTAPAVGLLLAQAALPTQASAYGIATTFAPPP